MNAVIWQPGMTLESMEKEIILAGLRFYRGNITQTALSLGVAEKTIRNKMEKYDNDRKQFEQGQRDAELERAAILKRLRGEIPARPVETPTLDDSGAGFHSSPSRDGIQPVVETSEKHDMPVPVRKEVQSVLPQQAANGGPRRGR